MLLLKSKKKWWKIPVVGTIFSNDDRACRSTLLKTVSRHRHFNWPSPQISEQHFKEHPWKAATVLQKNILFKRSRLRACYSVCLW